MTQADDRTQPPIGWYQTGRTVYCSTTTARDRYRPTCHKRLDPGARVLLTGPTRDEPRGLLLCEPCGAEFLDRYVEPLDLPTALAVAERCLVANTAWEQDIALALGKGPMMLEEAL